MKETMPQLISRWQAVSWYYKFYLSILTLTIGGFIQFVNVTDATPGLKAALLAILAGGILFIEFLPTRKSTKGRLADFSNRAVGGVLAIGVGWNWIVSETDGTAWIQIGPYLLVIVYAVLGLSIGFFIGLAIKRQEPKFNIETSIDQLADEYKQLRDALEDDETRPDEIWGFMYATEITLTNVLLYLWADPNTELDPSKMKRFWVYADTETQEYPGANASKAHYRRLRKLVEGSARRSLSGN